VLRRTDLEPALHLDRSGKRPGSLDVAVIELYFDYPSGSVPASVRRRARIATPVDNSILRDAQAESQARRALEGFGPVEADMLEDWVLPTGERADYVLDLEGDATQKMSFSATCIPQLETMGWKVDFAPGYPWRAISGSSPWYVRCKTNNASPIGSDAPNDWFELELGILVGGERVDLMPALLRLLEGGVQTDDLERLLPVGSRGFPLELADGRRVMMPVSRMRILLHVLGDLFSGRRNCTLELSSAVATRMAELDAAFSDNGSVLQFDGEAAQSLIDRGRSLRTKPTAVPDEVQPPVGLQAELRPYQRAGLAWLQHLRHGEAGGVLADDMGLGKTLQTIAHVLAEKIAGRLDIPVLIITPTSLIGNWKREIAKFAPALKVLGLVGTDRKQNRYRVRLSDVVLTSYPVLVRDIEYFSQLPVHMVILDEAQAIKNSNSQAHAAVQMIPARHRLCLSGTPVENSVTELWSQMEFLMPGLLGSEEQFKHRFKIPIEREGNHERLSELRSRVEPFLLRRTKEQVVPELPPKTELVRPVELRGGQRDLYESIRLAANSRIRQAIDAKGLQASTFTILDALMKLRQVCCDPRLVPVEKAREVTESAKFEMLFEMLEQQLPQGRRVLVFSQFATMLGLIGNGLKERGISHVTLTGATRDREKVVDTFEKGHASVFLISLKAGGTGLNLVSADTVVHYDPWWNPAVQAQATDRAYRIGQKRPVFVFNLIAAGSVEERMLALQHRKRGLADGILNGARAEREFSIGDVDSLMAPLE